MHTSSIAHLSHSRCRPPCFRRLRSVALFGLLVTASAQLASGNGDLRSGAAQVKITPPNGIPLAGYYHERGADGVLDDLYAKALVLEQDGVRVAFVALDLISTTRSLVERARAEIEKTTGLKGESIMISATHAHTGPELSNRGRRSETQTARNELTTQYSERLPSLIAASVQMAERRLELSRISAAVGREEHLSFNRRFYMRDGSVGWNPGKMNREIVAPAGSIDPEVGVLLVESPATNRASGRPIATYVNFAMHPDTTGGNQFSADYPGALARVLAGCKDPDMVTFFANGACGNINHLDVNWAASQSGPPEAQRIGVVLGAAVLQAYKQLQPVRPGPLRMRRELVQLPLPSATPPEVEQARRDVSTANDRTRDGFMKLVQGYKILDVAARAGQPLEVEVQVMAYGPDLAWVSLPGEIFVELGLAIKKRSPFRYTLIAELANGSIGYIPDRRSYAEGNYEPVSARCAPGSGERLVETAVHLLEAMQEAKIVRP